MMNHTIFDGPIKIAMHGSEVLDLIAIESDSAKYKIIGFEESILICDFREDSLFAIREVVETGNVGQFGDIFSQSAYAVVEKKDYDQYSISLYETEVPDPEHVLWFVVGLEEYLPLYDYVFYEIKPFSQDRFAAFAVYHRLPFGKEVIELEEEDSYPQSSNHEAFAREDVWGVSSFFQS